MESSWPLESHRPVYYFGYPSPHCQRVTLNLPLRILYNWEITGISSQWGSLQFVSVISGNIRAFLCGTQVVTPISGNDGLVQPTFRNKMAGGGMEESHSNLDRFHDRPWITFTRKIK